MAPGIVLPEQLLQQAGKHLGRFQNVDLHVSSSRQQKQISASSAQMIQKHHQTGSSMAISTPTATAARYTPQPFRLHLIASPCRFILCAGVCRCERLPCPQNIVLRKRRGTATAVPLEYFLSHHVFRREVFYSQSLICLSSSYSLT